MHGVRMTRYGRLLQIERVFFINSRAAYGMCLNTSHTAKECAVSEEKHFDWNCVKNKSLPSVNANA